MRQDKICPIAARRITNREGVPTGSKGMGLERNSMATIRNVDAPANILTVERPDGVMVSYDPRRLRSVNVFREAEREFARSAGARSRIGCYKSVVAPKLATF